MKYTANGIAVVNNTIAVKRNYKNANNEYESDFINIKVFNKTAEYLANYAEKGSKVLLRGHIQTGSYEKNGNKVYTTDIMVESINIVNTKSKVQNKKEDDTVVYIDDVSLDDDNFLDS